MLITSQVQIRLSVSGGKAERPTTQVIFGAILSMSTGTNTCPHHRPRGGGWPSQYGWNQGEHCWAALIVTGGSEGNRTVVKGFPYRATLCPREKLMERHLTLVFDVAAGFF